MMEKDDLEAKGTERRGRREEKEDIKIKATTGETSRRPQTGEGKEHNTVGLTYIKHGREVQSSEIQIGTLNISGIAFSYRGKYIKTEEELLKIKPGDKLREVTEMMKTQGISLMTLTDTHLNQEGMKEVGTFLQQEGLGGGGINRKSCKMSQRVQNDPG
eukprot:4388320-Pleurochrysis_carterae.AAC.1